MRTFTNRIAARFWLIGFAYSSILAASFYLAYELRFDFVISPEQQEERLRLLKYILRVFPS